MLYSKITAIVYACPRLLLILIIKMIVCQIALSTNRTSR